MYLATVYTEDETYYIRAISKSLRDKAIDRVKEDEEIFNIEYSKEGK